MTLSYPFNNALNLTPEPSRMVLEYISFSKQSQSPFSGSIQATLNPAVGQWGISLAFPPMAIDNAAKWISLFASLYGSYGTILLPMYKRESIRGSGAGTPVINGANQTGTSVAIDGMTASQTDVFKQFDLINIGNDLYEVVRDVDSDGSGEGTMEIFPALRSSPADDAAIITSDVTGVFRQKPDFNLRVDINNAAHFGFGWEGIEAV